MPRTSIPNQPTDGRSPLDSSAPADLAIPVETEMNAMIDTTALVGDNTVEVPARALKGLADAIAPTAPVEPRSLVETLAERNVLVDEVNALARTEPEPPQEALDAITDRYNPLEDALRLTRAETVDDLVAKIAFVAELVRESACPNLDDVSNVLNDAQRILLRACDPMTSEQVEHRDARWTLVIKPEPRAAPAGDLAAIVADALEFAAKVYKPAHDAHSEAEAAYMAAPKDQKPDYDAIEALRDVYDRHLDTLTEKHLQILQLPASSPAELLTNAATCAELLAPYLSDRTGADTNHGKLIRDHQVLLLDYLMASLAGLATPASPSDPAPDDNDAQLVADINEVIRLSLESQEKSRQDRPGAAGDLLDEADVPMQRSLLVRATTPAGLLARARLVDHWNAPVDNSREDLDWQVTAALIEDVKALTSSSWGEQRPSAAMAALSDQLARRWAEERAHTVSDVYEDAKADALIKHSAAAAYQLLALPANSLADFRAKAKAVEWSVSGYWEDFDSYPEAKNLAVALICELIGNTDAGPTPSPTDPTLPAPEPEGWAGKGDGNGGALSPKLPDATTPLALAVAHRDKLRAEARAWEDEHDDNPTAEMNVLLGRAEAAVFEAPAMNAAEILWQFLENEMEDGEAWTHDEAIALIEAEVGLEGSARRGLVANLRRLAAQAGEPVPSFAAADSDLVTATEEFFRIDRLQNDTVGAMPSLTPARDAALERALTMPANSLDGLKAHLAIVRDWMPVEGAFEPDSYHYPEWRAVRALVGDVERLVVPTALTDPKMIELERLLDQAIADRKFLDGHEHGLTDDEWTARDAIGEDAASAVSYLKGDGADLQRLRIKALGWFCRYDVDQSAEGLDLEERLTFRLFQSACKVAA